MGCSFAAGNQYKSCVTEDYGTSSGPSSGKVHPRRLSNPIQDLHCPAYWTKTDQRAQRRCVDCISESPSDVTNVQLLMNRTMTEVGHILKVESLLRIEDPLMWSTFERSVVCISESRSTPDEPQPMAVGSSAGSLQQEPLTTRGLDEDFRTRLRGEANETYLWHGTDRESAESIVTNAFNPIRAGEASAKALGREVYFAESASLADQYAPAGPDGLHQMLLVRAALGKVCMTKRYTSFLDKTLVRTLSATNLARSGKFDSFLGDRKLSIREYCVANSSQLYPEYLVFYSRQDPRNASCSVGSSWPLTSRCQETHAASSGDSGQEYSNSWPLIRLT